MTKEQQAEAAKRIMAKMGPLDEMEQEIYEGLVKRPEDYIPPDPGQGERVCGICGAKFRDIVSGERVVATCLEQFSDHQAEHNPSPAQWAEAYHRIQASRPKKADM